METKICEVYTKIKILDNVKQPADLINRHDIREKENGIMHNFIKN